MTHAHVMPEFLDWCRLERNKAAADLPDYESGRIKIGTQVLGQEMIDGTPEYIAHLKRVIENMTVHRLHGHGSSTYIGPLNKAGRCFQRRIRTIR